MPHKKGHLPEGAREKFLANKKKIIDKAKAKKKAPGKKKK